MFRKGDQAWKGKQHTEETKQKMSEAAKRRWQIKNELLPMPAVPEEKASGWAWKGRKHTVETRRKMSAAHSHRSDIVCRKPEEGYRLLITAVICRALKDNAVNFFHTDTGKYYCDLAGLEPDKLLEKHNMHITRIPGRFAADKINQ